MRKKRAHAKEESACERKRETFGINLFLRDQMMEAKSRNTGLTYQMKSAAATAKVMPFISILTFQCFVRQLGEHMKTTAVAMGQVNRAMNVQQLQQTTQMFQKETAKSQMQQEMMSEFLADLDDSDLEEEADEEVDGVLFEITQVCTKDSLSALPFPVLLHFNLGIVVLLKGAVGKSCCCTDVGYAAPHSTS